MRDIILHLIEFFIWSHWNAQSTFE